MKIIVGLGNPDAKYRSTYHNMGFMALDRFAENNFLSLNKNKCQSKVCETEFNGEKVILAKPVTYMNLSGIAVAELLKKYRAEPKDLLIVYDDIDIEKGTIRYRENGSAGTHNGMRNIVEKTGTTEIKRIRIGIMPAQKPLNLADYVLDKVDKGEWLDTALELASDKIKEFILK